MHSNNDGTRSAERFQRTLGDAFAFSGPGLHTGATVNVEVRPAPPNSGRRFVVGGAEIPALAEYVVETARATVLGRAGVTVSTVEHLLAALLGCGISNAAIHLDGPEVPVADGSARSFVEAIGRAGVRAQGELQERYVPSAPVFMRDAERLIAVLPSTHLRVRFVADFPAPVGVQLLDAAIDQDVFAREIAGARTFGYLHEVQALLDRGLAKGGTLENAVVFAPEGPLQELRWPNEPVRHKTLDLLGDFALLGAYPQCEIVAVRSGHRLHCLMAAEIRKTLAQDGSRAGVAT